MSLSAQDLEQITQHIKTCLPDLVAEQSLGKPPVVYEIELRERMVRVEEELKHQRELMQQGFHLMEKRFDRMDARFEKIDARFEKIDARFEKIDARFEKVDDRFDNMHKQMQAFIRWSFGLTITSSGVIIAVLRLWPTSP